jgi:hypothetical protein
MPVFLGFLIVGIIFLVCAKIQNTQIIKTYYNITIIFEHFEAFETLGLVYNFFQVVFYSLPSFSTESLPSCANSLTSSSSSVILDFFVCSPSPLIIHFFTSTYPSQYLAFPYFHRSLIISFQSPNF